MFSRLGATLIGIPTGRTTDRVVIDVDPQHGGDIWLNKNKEAIPPTLTHSTPRGGFHLIFRNPPEMEIRNSQGRIASGVDVRGTGGYAIVPQAKVTRSNTMARRLTMPAWLIDACRTPERPPVAPLQQDQPPPSGSTPYGLKALSDECNAICDAPFGRQEDTLNSAVRGKAASATLRQITR